MRATKRVLAMPAAIVTMSILAACAGEIPTPTTPTAARVQGGVAFNATSARKHIPNAKKYRDKGAKPAKGRAGSATLEVRALLGNTGVVKLEASTGSLEAGTNPGTIVKVEVRIRARKGPPRTYTKLSGDGYWTTTLLGLAPGDLIEVKAHVTGIDRKRTDVVTAVATVMRLPDLAVESVTGPGEAPPDVPVTFVASVLNTGDLGANADCVLAVDGAVVAQAPRIWVDAGDNVSCLFTHAFAVSGAHEVRVSLANVTPGDWNAANNSASTPILIAADPSTVGSGSFLVYDFEFTSRHREYNIDGDFPFDFTIDTRHNHTLVTASGEEPHGLEAVQRVEIAIDLDGARVNMVTMAGPFDNGGSYVDGTNWTRCWRAADAGYSFNSCSTGSTDAGSPASTYFQIQNLSGSVTYFSDGCVGSPDSCGGYVLNPDEEYGTQPQIKLRDGGTLRLFASIFDGLESHVIDKTVRNYFDTPYVAGLPTPTCTPDPIRLGNTCIEESYPTNGRLRQGIVYWP